MKQFKDRPLVYVAGPYVSPDPVENTHNTIKAADMLQSNRFDGLVTCYVPHLTLLWHMVCPHDDPEYWYEYDYAILTRCDALLRLSGKSSGADREVALAEELHIPVFYDQELLLEWAKNE